jgi:hypothetical protein
MFISRLILVFGIVGLLVGCASGTIDLAGDKQSGELATITAAHRFYLFSDYDCGILDVDSTSNDSQAGAKRVNVPEGLHHLRIRCIFQIPNPALRGHVYFGNLSFLAQAGHEYTVLFQYMRKCIIVIDEENDAEVNSDCDLTGYSTPF